MFHGNGGKESSHFENLLHAKWSNFAKKKTKKSTKFSGMLGEDEKKIRENFVKNFKRVTKQIGKRLLPGSGETDCNVSRVLLYSADSGIGPIK